MKFIISIIIISVITDLIYGNELPSNFMNPLMSFNECKTADEIKVSLERTFQNIFAPFCFDEYLCIELGRICGTGELPVIPEIPVPPKPPKVISHPKDTKPPKVSSKPPPSSSKPPIKNLPPPVTPKPKEPGFFDILKIFEDDCELLIPAPYPIVEVPPPPRAILRTEYRNPLYFMFKQSDPNQQFSSISTSKPKTRFYRKIHMKANVKLSDDVFKEGLNIIVLKRDIDYEKLYEKTYKLSKTNFALADELADVINKIEYDKIVILTGIGNWIQGVNNRLITEIKKIGGPDLQKILTVYEKFTDLEEELFINFALIGRYNLCENNGLIEISSNIDFNFYELITSSQSTCKKSSINPRICTSSPCYYNLVDLQIKINLINENRFSHGFPIIFNIEPHVEVFDSLPRSILDIRLYVYYISPDRILKTVEIKDIAFSFFCLDIIVNKIDLLPNVFSINCKLDFKFHQEIANGYVFNGNSIVGLEDKGGIRYYSPRETCCMFSYRKESNIVIKKKLLIRSIPKVIVKEICCPLVKPIIVN